MHHSGSWKLESIQLTRTCSAQTIVKTNFKIKRVKIKVKTCISCILETAVNDYRQTKRTPVRLKYDKLRSTRKAKKSGALVRRIQRIRQNRSPNNFPATFNFTLSNGIYLQMTETLICVSCRQLFVIIVILLLCSHNGHMLSSC